MALNETSLVTQRDALVTLIGNVLANPKPTYTIEGRTVQWTQYLAELRNQFNWLNEAIDLAGGPLEIHSEAF
jgi:hypothetical protein